MRGVRAIDEMGAALLDLGRDDPHPRDRETGEITAGEGRVARRSRRWGCAKAVHRHVGFTQPRAADELVQDGAQIGLILGWMHAQRRHRSLEPPQVVVEAKEGAAQTPTTS